MTSNSTSELGFLRRLGGSHPITSLALLLPSSGKDSVHFASRPLALTTPTSLLCQSNLSALSVRSSHPVSSDYDPP